MSNRLGQEIYISCLLVLSTAVRIFCGLLSLLGVWPPSTSKAVGSNPCSLPSSGPDSLCHFITDVRLVFCFDDKLYHEHHRVLSTARNEYNHQVLRKRRRAITQRAVEPITYTSASTCATEGQSIKIRGAYPLHPCARAPMQGTAQAIPHVNPRGS